MPSPRALKKNAKIPLSHDHLASKYGDVLDYLALTTNILDAAENCTEYVQSNSLFACDKNIQCDLLTEDGTHVLDPSRLSYEERLKWHFKEFCYKTSSHGIPMIGQAPNKIYRAVWIVLLLGCTIMFAHQASNVIEKFNRMDKITNILLKFDTAPFPAITLCNLNPYKQSLIGRVELVRRTLKVFNDVMKRAGKGSGSDSDAKIRKRSTDASFVPAHSKCDCTNGESNICEAITDDVPTAADSMCLCAFDSATGDAWPCFSKNLWTLEQCDQCDEHGNCLKAGTT
uniref:Degenerin mec-4/10 cytosolic domain-containing protein n=2 Tax=Plectus sambesii TaxID=2011161 RepID=A0A914UVE8_9BILA